MRKTALFLLLLTAFCSTRALAQDEEALTRAPPPAEEAVDETAEEVLPAALERRIAEQEAKFEAQLEALKKENEENLEQLKEELESHAEEEASQTMMELTPDEKDVNRLLQLYGFFDINFYKYFFDDRSAFHIFLNDASSFFVSNFNLYMKSQLTDTLSALGELHFSFLPYGHEYGFEAEVDGTDMGEQYQTINENEGFLYRDPVSSQEYHPGSLTIERIHLTWSPRDWFNVLAGRYLTPYGIWNIEHGSPVVLPARVPYMQIRQMVPQAQTGLQIFGRLFPRYNLYIDYAITLSNGRQEFMETTMDIDENKAVGLRLRGMYEGEEITIALGSYGYYGKASKRKKRAIVNTQEKSLEVDVETVRDADDFVLSSDFLLTFHGVKVQAEYVFNYFRADTPNYFAYDDELFLAGDLTGSITGNPVYFRPNAVGRGIYGLLAYELPLHKWLGDITITPYFMYEHNMYWDIMPQVNMKHLFAGGINFRPSAYVVLKAEFNYVMPELDRYGGDMIVVIGQTAVSF